jgi:hypothetical protein
MTLDLREVAHQQNDTDHAVGLLPSRYVEDEVVLHRVAGLLLSGRKESASVGASPASASPFQRSPGGMGDAAPVRGGQFSEPGLKALGRAGRGKSTALKGGGRRAPL